MKYLVSCYETTIPVPAFATRLPRRIAPSRDSLALAGGR